MFYELKYTSLSNLQTEKQTSIKILKTYCSYSSSPMFFSVNNVVRLAIMNDSKQSSVVLP
jgi:hypothetical protein